MRHPARDIVAVVCYALLGAGLGAQSLPLPEHPRPDFERAEWLNLNGRWEFAFDRANDGERAGWASGSLPAPREILVPFSWGSPLSGVPDSADIGWYARSITVPAAWRGRRVFVVFGASDWRTTAWLDGQKLGDHQGGYTPFSFELTSQRRAGQPQRLVVRVDDRDHPFKLEGKQGYGKARGMWQTVYLEARGTNPIDAVHFTPHADLAGVGVDVRLLEPATSGEPVTFATVRVAEDACELRRRQKDIGGDIPTPNHRFGRGDRQREFLFPILQRLLGRLTLGDIGSDAEVTFKLSAWADLAPDSDNNIADNTVGADDPRLDVPRPLAFDDLRKFSVCAFTVLGNCRLAMIFPRRDECAGVLAENLVHLTRPGENPSSHVRRPIADTRYLLGKLKIDQGCHESVLERVTTDKVTPQEFNAGAAEYQRDGNNADISCPD